MAWSIALALALLLSLLALALVARLTLAARRAKLEAPAEGVVGFEGRAEGRFPSEGAVLVSGRLWPARSSMRIERGERVRVVGIDRASLALVVEKIGD